MRMKTVAGCGFLINTLFFGTYYAVSKEALSRIDPIIFSFFEMVSLVPVVLLILLLSRKHLTRTVVKRGILLGSSLCLALFTISIALKYTTATSTAFFPALNGFVAALIAWLLFRQPVKKLTWFAGLISVAGAALLILSSSMDNWRGTLIAFLGGLFFTCYVFLSDQEQKDETAHWPLFGVELLTMAVWANLVVLLFGDWSAVHPELPKDIWVVLYVAGACTFLPTLVTVLFQKYISPVTVSFIYILEPVLGAIFASIYLKESLSLQGYVGGALVVLGALIHTSGTIGRPASARSLEQLPSQAARRVHASWASILGYPLASCVVGFFLLYELGGVPPNSWRELYQLWPQLSLLMHQGQSTYVILLAVQSAAWLIAWLSLILIGCMAIYRSLHRLLTPRETTTVVSLHSSVQPIVYTSDPVTDPYGSFIFAPPATYYHGEPELVPAPGPYPSSPAWNLSYPVEEDLDLYVRSSRQLQVGSAPYALPRKGEKVLLQRRRKDRLARLRLADS